MGEKKKTKKRTRARARHLIVQFSIGSLDFKIYSIPMNYQLIIKEGDAVREQWYFATVDSTFQDISDYVLKYRLEKTKTATMKELVEITKAARKEVQETIKNFFG